MNRLNSWLQRQQIILIILCLLFSSTSWAQGSSNQLVRGKISTFNPGDAVRITIWQLWSGGDKNNLLANFNQDYPIDGDGYIWMPVIGKLKVTGLSTESLTEVLREKFNPYFKEPVIIVVPLIRVTMQGAFNKPGAYRIKPTSSLWELVELAGGPGEACDLNKMWVERGGKVVNKKLLASFEKGYSLEDIGIRSGDQIIAPTRTRGGLNRFLNYASFAMSTILLYLQIRHYYYR